MVQTCQVSRDLIYLLAQKPKQSYNILVLSQDGISLQLLLSCKCILGKLTFGSATSTIEGICFPKALSGKLLKANILVQQRPSIELNTAGVRDYGQQITSCGVCKQ